MFSRFKVFITEVWSGVRVMLEFPRFIFTLKPQAILTVIGKISLFRALISDAPKFFVTSHFQIS